MNIREEIRRLEENSLVVYQGEIHVLHDILPNKYCYIRGITDTTARRVEVEQVKPLWVQNGMRMELKGSGSWFDEYRINFWTWENSSLIFEFVNVNGGSRWLVLEEVEKEFVRYVE